MLEIKCFGVLNPINTPTENEFCYYIHYVCVLIFVFLHSALVWQLMKAYTLSMLTKLAGTGHPIVDKEIIDWVNNKVITTTKPILNIYLNTKFDVYLFLNDIKLNV